MLHVLSPRPVPDGRGLCFSLQPGRGPEHQTKERQQRQEHKASHAANLPYPASGSLRRTERMGRKPRNGGHLSFLTGVPASTDLELKARLQSPERMLIKKVPGECYQHSPGRYDA